MSLLRGCSSIFIDTCFSNSNAFGKKISCLKFPRYGYFILVYIYSITFSALKIQKKIIFSPSFVAVFT